MRAGLPTLLARVRAWPPHRVDVALALVVVAASVAELVVGRVPAPTMLLAVPTVALVVVAILVRRRQPFAAPLLAVTGLALVWIAPYAVLDALTTVFLGWAFVTWSSAVRLERTRVVIATTASAALVVLVSILDGSTGAPQILTGLVLFVAAPTTAGRMLRSRNGLVARLDEQRAQLEAERASRVEESVTGERVRIAGELHDVVAHALGAMTIQAAVARRMADRDVERAGAAFQAVETTGREALTELRTLMEVLRHDPSDGASLEPQPGLDGLLTLTERLRARGLPVELSFTGTAPADLPQGVELTAYRVVQDALGEALARGGAGRAAVMVAFRDETLELVVEDDGVRAAGRRLLGLRERVRVCGGAVEAGAHADGGHAVHVRLPLIGVPA